MKKSRPVEFNVSRLEPLGPLHPLVPEGEDGVLRWLESNGIDVDHLEGFLRYGRRIKLVYWLGTDPSCDVIYLTIRKDGDEYIADLLGSAAMDLPQRIEDELGVDALDDGDFLQTLRPTLEVRGTLTYLSLVRLLEEVSGFGYHFEASKARYWSDARAAWQRWQRGW